MSIITPVVSNTLTNGNNWTGQVAFNSKNQICQFAGSNNINSGLDIISTSPLLSIINNIPYTNSQWIPSGYNNFCNMGSRIFAIGEGNGLANSSLIEFNDNFTIKSVTQIGDYFRSLCGDNDNIYTTTNGSPNNIGRFNSNGFISIATPTQVDAITPIIYAVSGYCMFFAGSGNEVYILTPTNTLLNFSLLLMTFNTLPNGFCGLYYDSGGFSIIEIAFEGTYTKKYITGINLTLFSGFGTVSALWSDGITYYLFLQDNSGLFHFFWITPQMNVYYKTTVAFLPALLNASGNTLIASIGSQLMLIQKGLWPQHFVKTPHDPARLVRNYTIDGRLNWSKR